MEGLAKGSPTEPTSTSSRNPCSHYESDAGTGKRPSHSVQQTNWHSNGEHEVAHRAELTLIRMLPRRAVFSFEQLVGLGVAYDLLGLRIPRYRAACLVGNHGQLNRGS